MHCLRRAILVFRSATWSVKVSWGSNLMPRKVGDTGAGQQRDVVGEKGARDVSGHALVYVIYIDQLEQWDKDAALRESLLEDPGVRSCSAPADTSSPV